MDAESKIDINNIRRSNLERLIQKEGSIAKFAEKIEKDPTQISQIRNGVRNIGEKFAREIEDLMGFPKYFMDEDQSNYTDSLDVLFTKIRKQFDLYNLTKDESHILIKYRGLNDEQKRLIINIIESYKA